MTGYRIDAADRRIVIDEAKRSVAIVQGGPPGPQGPPGASGQAISYEHVQATTASSWVINHNMNYKPAVTVEEQGTGYEIICGIIHHSTTQVELQFNTPRAGTAHLT